MLLFCLSRADWTFGDANTHIFFYTAAQTAILLNLKSYEHLSEVMAEFLSVLSAQFDNRQLTEDILREISKMEFNERDTLCAKSFSKFLIKLSEVLPKEVLKQMVLLQNQVDSEVIEFFASLDLHCPRLI